MKGHKFLKVTGILMIIAAAFSILAGVLVGGLGALAAGAGAASGLTFAYWAALFLTLVGGICQLIAGIKGIKHTYSNAQDAVKAGEIFKKDRVILEYMGMEIYSSINQMVVNFGDRLTRTVLKQLGETEKRVLAKYYKCKEDIAETARQLGMSEDDVKTSLNMVRINTGLDVNDTEDNFKLHFIMIAKKVLENDERIKKNR